MLKTRSKANEGLLVELKAMVDAAKEPLKTLHSDWDDYRNMYEGEHTEGITLPDDLATDFVPINLAFAHTETRIPLLAGASPTWYVQAPDDGDDADAEGLTAMLQALWQRRQIDREYKKALRDQIILGSGALKAWWDPSLGPVTGVADGPGKYELKRAGDVNVSWVSPFTIYPDPDACNLDDCEYLAFSHDLSPRTIKQRYGTELDKDKAERLEIDTDDGGKNQSAERGMKWPKSAFSRKSQATSTKEIYRVWEVYHEGGARLSIYSGSQLLFDGENPTPNGRFPLVIFKAYESGYAFWGMAETSQVYDLQQLIDKVLFRVNCHIRLNATPQWLTDDKDFKPNNEPGVALHVKRDHYAKRESPPALPAHTFPILQFLMSMYDTITGVRDVTRGMKPGSIQSGIGIQQLQEAANTRLTDMAQDNGRDLERLGQIVLEMMQAKYQEKRSLPYMDGARKLKATVEPQMLRQTLVDPTGSGEEVQLPYDYTVVVQPGSDLPLNAMAAAELALKLATLPAEDGSPMLDREGVFDAIKLQGRREILQRAQERAQGQIQGQAAAMQEQQAMAQMAAQQGGAPPQGGGQPMPSEQDLQQMMMADAGGGLPPESMEGTGDPTTPDNMGGGAEGSTFAAPPIPPNGEGDPEALLAELGAMLSPEEFGEVQVIMANVGAGGDLSEEDLAFVLGLPEEAQGVVRELLAILAPDDLAAVEQAGMDAMSEMEDFTL